MNKLIALIDKSRDFLLESQLDSSAQAYLNEVSSEELIQTLEMAIRMSLEKRLRRPDKILSRAIMIPSYRRKIEELKKIPNN